MASNINLNLNDNGFRASKLLIDGGGYLTKQIILQKAITGTITNMDEFLAKKHVRKKINNLKSNNLIKGSQSDILYPTNGSPTNLDEWDITLFTLILNECITLNPAEKNAVKDIRKLRNTLYGHTSKVEMTDAEFQLKLTDISTTLTTHSTLLTDPNSITFIKDMIIRISKETLSADKTIQTLKEWYKWGMEVEHKIEEMMEDQKTFFAEAETKCEVRHRESTDQLANIRTSQERTADDVSTILKLVKKGRRPAVHGGEFSRKLYQRGNTQKRLGRMSDKMSALMNLAQGDKEQTVDRTELNRKIKQAKLQLKEHQQNLEKFNIPENTRMTETVTQQLQKNKIVVLKGIPGAGKTHLAKNVLNHFMSLNPDVDPLIISKASGIERVLDPDKSFVLLVDDMIGKISFDATEYNDWIQNVETFMSNVKVGRLYVVLTIRTAIFRQCHKNAMANMFATENVIDTDIYLLENEKRDILELYRKYSDIDISSDQSDQIVQQQYLGIGFPLLCRIMKGRDVDVVEMFMHPKKYIKDEISSHASHNPLVYVTLFLTLIGDNVLNKHELTQDQMACFKTLQDYFKTSSMDMNMLYKTAHVIEKTFITFTEIENNFSFIHEAVAHSIFEVALEIQPAILIERCPFDSLIRNMNLMTEPSNVEGKPTNPYMLHKQRIINRMKHVLSLEDCTNIRHVTSATFWNNKTFANNALCMFDTKHLYREDENGMSMLSHFASDGRKFALEAAVEQLEKEHIKPNNQLQNALGKACKSGKKECVDYLLKQKVDVSAHVVIEAVKGGEMKIVKQITNRYGFDKIKTLKKNDTDKTLIHIAAEKGRLDIVTYIHKICPSLLNTSDRNGCNAAHLAAKTSGINTIECLEFLINMGINPTDNNSSGMSILHQATFSGKIATLKYICETYPDMIHVTDTYRNNALHHAARSGSVECMKFLVEKGIDTGDTNDTEETILHHSAMGVNIATMKYICETYPDMILETDKYGNNALHHAARTGSVECMKFLVEKGIDTGNKTDDEETILHMSAMGGNITTMTYIYETYPDVIRETDKYGNNSLHYAAFLGNVECMKFLVDKGINTGDTTDDGETILHMSAMGGNITTMTYICETYPDMILETDNVGNNALHHAAYEGSVECMKFLVDKGIDTCDKTDDEKTILHRSAMGGNIATMEYICETYPDMILETDKYRSNALHHAARSGSVECMKFFVDKGIDTCDKTDDEKTILHRSAMGGNIATMEYICETYPDMILETDKYRSNALHHAARSGSVECMKFLVEKGIDPGDSSDNDETILHHSAMDGNIATMKYICETYPDMILETDKYGYNALHHAARRGSIECMKFLVEKGINTGDTTDDGETILHMSVMGGNITTMTYICETYPDMILETDKYRSNALHHAARSGSVECMKFLVEKGINPGDKNVNEETILHMSAKGGNIAILKYICETYPDMIRETDTYRNNALHHAARSGSVECMKFLVEKGIDTGDTNDTEETILHHSAMGVNIATMKYICETYPDMIRETDKYRNNALHHAARSESVECMKFLVEKGIDPGDSSDNDETILHHSAMDGNIATMKYICETYPDMILETDKYGYNALHHAARRGSIECMKFLVEKGINTGDTTDDGETILHMSVMGGNITTMTYICETYPDMILETDKYRRNALHHAARSGSVECMKFLVEKGINPGDKNDNEETILHMSAKGGNIAILKYICETYPDMIRETDKYRNNALHHAARSGSVECMKFLVEKGIDPGDKSSNEKTILHLSAKGGNITTMKYICETYPGMIRETDNDGNNALHHAAYEGSIECMKFLVEKGIDPGDTNDDEKTILHRSAIGINIATLKYICETYPDMIHVTDKYGSDALHHAARSGSVECMKFLVKKGIDPGDTSDNKETILHHSAIDGNITTMKYICETYPDMIHITDKDGNNALYYAAKSGSVESKKYLVDKGIDSGDKTEVEKKC